MIYHAVVSNNQKQIVSYFISDFFFKFYILCLKLIGGTMTI